MRSVAALCRGALAAGVFRFAGVDEIWRVLGATVCLLVVIELGNWLTNSRVDA